MIALKKTYDRNCPDQDQFSVIAEGERLGEGNATLLPQYLVHISKGPKKVRQMISDDMQLAMRRGNCEQAARLFGTLQRFLKDYPEAAREAF